MNRDLKMFANTMWMWVDTLSELLLMKALEYYSSIQQMSRSGTSLCFKFLFMTVTQIKWWCNLKVAGGRRKQGANIDPSNFANIIFSFLEELSRHLLRGWQPSECVRKLIISVSKSSSGLGIKEVY